MLSLAIASNVVATSASAASHGVSSPALRSQGVPVFMYHRIDHDVPSDEIGRELTLDPATFERELRQLHDARIATITASELVDDLKRGNAPSRTVVLTFDDGYSDAASEVLPLLRKYGMRGTFYVVTGTIGKPRHLSWREIRVLARAGMEIGAHGTEHYDLSTLSVAEQRAVATDCVHAIRRWTKIAASTYAYPSGQFNSATMGVMHDLRMHAAFTTQPGLVRSLASPYTLPRVRLNRRDADTVFAQYIDPLGRG